MKYLAYSLGVKLAFQKHSEGALGHITDSALRMGLYGAGAGALTGGGIGLLHGATMPGEDESRLGAAAKRGLIGAGIGGAVGGLGYGAIGGGVEGVGQLLRAAKEKAPGTPTTAIGAMVGGLIGGGLGYLNGGNFAAARQVDLHPELYDRLIAGEADDKGQSMREFVMANSSPEVLETIKRHKLISALAGGTLGAVGGGIFGHVAGLPSE